MNNVVNDKNVADDKYVNLAYLKIVLLVLIGYFLLLMAGHNFPASAMKNAVQTIVTNNQQSVEIHPTMPHIPKESQDDLAMPPVIELSAFSAHTESTVPAGVLIGVLLLGLLSLAVLLRRLG